MDSKTEKKIEVVPCSMCAMWDLHDAEKRFVLKIDGEIQPIFPDANRVCGTEAEAQQKAAELSGEIPAVFGTELPTGRTASGMEHVLAAVQPSDNRCKAIDPKTGMRCGCRADHADYVEHRIHALKGYTTFYTARAAAPVETPPNKRDDVWTAVRHADKEYDGPHPDSVGMTRAEYIGKAVMQILYADKPATELVEPAPRPQDSFAELRKQIGYQDALDAAASSPVARPQPDCKCGHTAAQHKQCPEGEYCDVKGCPCVDGNAEGFTLPAARVEQPTPSNFLSDFQMPSCSQCGSTYKVYCAECGNFKPAPAAPVVEQREKLSVVEFYMKNRPTILMGWSINCDKAIVRMMESYLEYRLNEILERAASQRTEGEGQHGK